MVGSPLKVVLPVIAGVLFLLAVAGVCCIWYKRRRQARLYRLPPTTDGIPSEHARRSIVCVKADGARRPLVPRDGMDDDGEERWYAKYILLMPEGNAL